MIEAVKLGKTYEDGTRALEDLELGVNGGEIYCLLGANGAGKTTTLNIFLNLIPPTSGQALIGGVDVDRDPLEAKRHLAYLSERVALYANLTPRQILGYFAHLAGRDGAIGDEIDQLLLTVGLPASAFDKRVKTFSKGMRQKLGIAVMMVKDAPAVLLDEPLSGLDPKAAAEFVGILKGFREAGKAVLMSTHDLFRAKELADRVGILKDGRKVAELDRDELERQDLERLYLEYMRSDA